MPVKDSTYYTYSRAGEGQSVNVYNTKSWHGLDASGLPGGAQRRLGNAWKLQFDCVDVSQDVPSVELQFPDARDPLKAFGKVEDVGTSGKSWISWEAAYGPRGMKSLGRP